MGRLQCAAPNSGHSGWLSARSEFAGPTTYIYAFPVQQAIIVTVPTLDIGTHVLLSTVVTGFLAVMSWHWIEKPALNWLPRLSGAASARPAEPA